MRSMLAVLVVLSLSSCATAPDAPGQDPPREEDSEALVGTTTQADANAGFTLAVEPDPAAPSAEAEIVIANQRDEPLELGAEYALDRWDGQEWSNALDCEGLCAWPDILYVVEPG
ncbi:MAG: hypothetical protein GEU81_16525, partial [Nitriliruptorales bacterium]|nr:hypothetical protein [Nitriliruptorales bacterium]